MSRPEYRSLKEAEKIISSERQDQYGEPEDSFTVISEFWTTYCGHHISPRDVAIMMALLKVAREVCGSGKRDNFIDALGYLAIAADKLDTSL